MNWKKFGIFLTFFATLLLCIDIYMGVRANYHYEKQYDSYWSLAEKASTIQKKIEGIDMFVAALENSNFKGKYNAISLTTPDNSFDYNYEALKSLQKRLHDISGMDETSFSYQTAIQQITQQEQGEASRMLSVFQGIYYKENYLLLWNWVAWVQIAGTVILLVIGIIVWISKSTDW